MREHLRRIEGQRAAFTATFSRFDQRSSYGYVIHTLLLVDVRNEHGMEVCDHVWFRLGKQFRVLDLKPGERVSFHATSRAYYKGYGEEHRAFKDYGLKNPTKVRRAQDPAGLETLPLFKVTSDQ